MTWVTSKQRWVFLVKLEVRNLSNVVFKTAWAGPPAHLLTYIQGLQVYQLSDIR
jgi:hypothetical protein